MSELAGKDRRALRALGHHLKPVVQIGQQGVTIGIIDAALDALDDHELIKVKVLEGAPVDRKEAAAKLAEETGAQLAQVLGRTFLLYKPNPKEPKIRIGEPPTAALHGHIGGEGDRPAARKPRRAISQGAGDEKPAGRKAPARKAPAKKAPARKAPARKSGGETAVVQPRRSGTGAALPPRRHGR
ncbi:ribosome assembly RNA-binding protein YhbY [Vulgatibacter sp.]|uniref:ribosome assembly RNA-binding protein YhbY n=1 Tax=Vulgatibacter sp. TaxID=1971226 RepID=UPI00356661F5